MTVYTLLGHHQDPYGGNNGFKSRHFPKTTEDILHNPFMKQIGFRNYTEDRRLLEG